MNTKMRDGKLRSQTGFKPRLFLFLCGDMSRSKGKGSLRLLRLRQSLQTAGKMRLENVCLILMAAFYEAKGLTAKDVVFKEFQEWKALHGKEYNSTTEERFRYCMIYIEV